jgi:hypothetical protein
MEAGYGVVEREGWMARGEDRRGKRGRAEVVGNGDSGVDGIRRLSPAAWNKLGRDKMESICAKLKWVGVMM